MRIAFFGTPEFAVPSLKALVNSKKHKVVCVVTQPDRPAGRGQDVVLSPVKKLALANKIPVLQPERISREVELLGPHKPDIIVTCAFGQILKQNVIDYCKHGVINVHASLLPKYRGASPIQWAIIKGETRTGITIAQTDIGLDTGDIIHATECDIGPKETAGELFARLSVQGAEALLTALDMIEAGTACRMPQDNSKATLAPMFKKTDGRIDFGRPAQQIINLVRGTSPWPGAYFASNIGDIKVHRASVGADGKLQLDIVQAPGKRPMPWKDFINGHKHLRFES